MKLTHITVFLLLTTLPLITLADPIGDIIHYLTAIQKLQHGIYGDEEDIDALTKQLEKDMKGHYGWGKRQFHDYGSWGLDSEDWQRILDVAKQGGSTSDLGQAIQHLSNEFPIHTEIVKEADANLNDQNYYALEANTVLAARAASELDFNKIQKQIDNQKTLQNNIESTQNVKAALDLQNRLQVENNLIQLEMLRQLSLINQQQAIHSQADINSTLKNANFLKGNP